MTKLYYTAPSDEIFNEVKSSAMQLWREVDTDNDKYGYASGKIKQIENIQNVSDNFMYMVAMFDMNNQAKLVDKLTESACKEIKDRMIDGGNTQDYLSQIGL